MPYLFSDPMTQENPKPKLPWHDTHWFRWAVIIGFSLLFVIKAAHVIFIKDKGAYTGQDFGWHLVLGKTVIDGTPYVKPDGTLIGQHYLPGRVIFNAALAIFPLKVAQAISYAIMVIVLIWMARVWGRMADGCYKASSGLNLGAAVLAFLLLMPWVVRDFDEAGLHIIMLFFLTAAGWCIYSAKPVAGGAWLALAITFKSTPLLLLPLLLLKRQWLAAAATVFFFVGYNVLLPVAIWGPTKAMTTITIHVDAVKAVISNPDPTTNNIEPPKHRNQNLPFTLARYLQTYEPGHPLYIYRTFDDDPKAMASVDPAKPEYQDKHPLFIQFLDLEPQTAKRTINVLILLLGLSIAWRMRRRWSLQTQMSPQGAEQKTAQQELPQLARQQTSLFGGESSFAPEWAVGCAFVVLLSPLTWLHHLTLLLPCCFLAVRDCLMFPNRSRARWIALGLVLLCVWILQRDPLPKQLALIVMSYHEDVIACLIMAYLALTVTGAVKTSTDEPRELPKVNA